MTCRVYCNTSIVQDITGVPDTGYDPFFFSVEGDELLFRFTQASFARVFSSLANGAYFTYGDEGRQVVWDFLVNVEFPVSFCEKMIECITTNPATLRAIVDALKADEDFNEYLQTEVSRLTTGQITGKIVEGSCDNSILAGKVVAIAERMNTTNEDFLQIVEIGTNDEERVAAIVAAIPVVGESPVDDIINFGQGILEDFTENYEAAVTEEWLNDVEQDLYCLAKTKDDCSLTYQDLFDYFQNRAGSNLTIGSIVSNIFSFVANGDFSTDDLVASGMYALQLAFVLAGREFAGMSVPKLGSLTRDADPSTKWEEWDECSPEPLLNITAYDFGSLSNVCTFIGFDEDGYEKWNIELAFDIFSPLPTYSIHDSEGRCYILRGIDGDTVEASSVDCAGVYHPSSPTHVIPYSYNILAGRSPMGTTSIVIHVQPDF